MSTVRLTVLTEVSLAGAVLPHDLYLRCQLASRAFVRMYPSFDIFEVEVAKRMIASGELELDSAGLIRRSSKEPSSDSELLAADPISQILDLISRSKILNREQRAALLLELASIPAVVEHPKHIENREPSERLLALASSLVRTLNLLAAADTSDAYKVAEARSELSVALDLELKHETASLTTTPKV